MSNPINPRSMDMSATLRRLWNQPREDLSPDELNELLRELRQYRDAINEGLPRITGEFIHAMLESERDRAVRDIISIERRTNPTTGRPIRPGGRIDTNLISRAPIQSDELVFLWNQPIENLSTDELNQLLRELQQYRDDITESLPNITNQSTRTLLIQNRINAERDIREIQDRLPRSNQVQVQISPLPEENLHKLSYETLVKQLYGLSVTLPEHLIVNGLKVNFIPFSQLNRIQIERYIIEPLLQPWAGPPSTRNRILTIFGTNGMTYLVKALYDPVSNQIFPPI